MFSKTLGQGLTVIADFSADIGGRCPKEEAARGQRQQSVQVRELVTAGERSA